MLDFDRNATRRTEVVDDESDYYKGVDEAKVREQRHGSRLNKKFTLNLESGKNVILYVVRLCILYFRNTRGKNCK